MCKNTRFWANFRRKIRTILFISPIFFKLETQNLNAKQLSEKEILNLIFTDIKGLQQHKTAVLYDFLTFKCLFCEITEQKSILE